MSFNPMDYPIALMFPSRNVFSAWSQHVPFGMLLVQLVQPKLLVELGTHRGMSYCTFCQAIKTLDMSCQAYAIDTWEGDAHAQFYGPDIIQDLRAYHDELYRNFSSLIQATFDDALPEFSAGSIDLLHIDGHHTYESVSHDFQTWLPKMSPSGVILPHDIVERANDFGVWKLWEEIKQQYSHTFEFHHGHGLGLVVVGETVPPNLQQIFDIKGNDLLVFRRLFYELGLRIEEKFEMTSLRSEMQRLLHSVNDDGSLKEEQTFEDHEIAELFKHLQTANTVRGILYDRSQLLQQESAVRDTHYRNELEQVRSQLRVVQGTRMWRLHVALWEARRRGVLGLAWLGKKALRKTVRSTLLRVRHPLRRLLKSLRNQSEDYRLIKSSGIFDEEWYHATYLDLAPESDAIDHYLKWGASEGRNPGPLFDGAWYLRHNRDVANASANPLLHYLKNGKQENRLTQSVGAARGEGKSIPINVPEDFAGGSIAVVIHGYYADVFEELCPYLLNLPGRFSLYVATPSEGTKRSVLASIKKHAINATVDVRVCPNRGRNFGPFLVEFASEVARHDFVLHIHTKKSLHMGGTQATVWRRDLYRTLIEKKMLVQMILAQFAEHPEVGVIYPATSVTMPYWAHHWLSNSQISDDLFQRLGIDDFQHSGLLDYPVGGMFWGRVEALRPLFTAGFTYDDFPPETGQTDGTLAHVIERAITQVASARDYGFIEVDYTHGVLPVSYTHLTLPTIYSV